MSIIAKPETFFKQFQKLHATKPVTVDILNVANPDALPAPLTVSRRGSNSPHVNKLVVSLLNEGINRLVVGGPTFTGVYLNLSDLMSAESIRQIKVSIEGTPVHAEIQYRQDRPEVITLEELTSEDRDPTLPPPPANNHLGTDPVLYVWPEKEVEIRPQESLRITLSNTSSDFRPALRFLDVSWKMERRTFYGTPRPDLVLEGLQQATIQLLRPADYVEPPFPLTAHWLNNNNLIYTAADDTTSLKNTLDFAISNIGLQDFTLDCNKHSRGVPYFELVMVGKKEGDTGDFSTAVADSADLVLAQIPDTTKNEDLNQLWRVNKRIQGPIVKWEIRPDLDFNFEQAKGQEGLSHKTLLGTDRNATITFRMSELRSKLDDGVALVYFRYYNMPDHDDGQIVLFLEKRRISTGGNMIAQLDKFENEVASPLRWQQEKVGDVPTTRVFIGDDIQAEGQEDRLLDLNLTVLGNTSVQGETNLQGNTTVRGDMSIINVAAVDDSGMQTETRRGTLKITGSMNGSDMHRVAAIHAEGDNFASGAPMNAATRMVFATRNSDASMSDKMVLTADGKLLIGPTANPTQKLQLKDGNFLLDGGELHATNGLVIKTGTSSASPESARFTLNQKGTDTLVIEDDGTIDVKGKIEVDELDVRDKMEVEGDIEMTRTETYIYPAKGKFVRLGKGDSALQDIFCRFTYFGDTRAVSDRASKQDIRPLAESIDATELLGRLQPVSYRRKDNPDIDLTAGCNEQAIRYGFIANDVQKILPDAVGTVGETETLCLDYQALNTVLFQAVKTQEERIAKLEAEMAKMRAFVLAMKTPSD